jgi:hypothetical protein
MNLFFLDDNPLLAARMHSDKHVGKMLVETAQMLSTGLRLAGHDIGYRVAYRNHPMTIWVRSGAENFAWAYALARGLAEEFEYRFGRRHKTADQLGAMLTGADWRASFGTAPLMPVPLCMPAEYKIASDPVACYRALYRGEKAYFAKYTRRPAPEFMRDVMPGVQVESP